jgi:hypothetical protein
MGKKKKSKRDTGKRAASRDHRSVDVNVEGMHPYQLVLSREDQKKLEARIFTNRRHKHGGAANT